MYALPDLYALVNQNVLDEVDASSVMNFPIKVADLVEVIMKYEDELKKNFCPRDHKLYGKALFLVKEYIENMPHEAVKETEIVAYDGQHSNSELVYGIFKCE